MVKVGDLSFLNLNYCDKSLLSFMCVHVINVNVQITNELSYFDGKINSVTIFIQEKVNHSPVQC